jgi:hypothetical protein
MKKSLIAVCIFTAITFLALPMGDVAQGDPPNQDLATFSNQLVRVNLIKGFQKDNAAWNQVESKRATPDKIFGEMVIEGGSGEKIKIAFTNPCTYVCVGTLCYKRCTY